MLSCFFFNDTATTEIYTLSLHDALPISGMVTPQQAQRLVDTLLARFPRALTTGYELLIPGMTNHPKDRHVLAAAVRAHAQVIDRKSTRLNSSHANISYAVFCLKKKTQSS